jgi:hypothetical protein
MAVRLVLIILMYGPIVFAAIIGVFHCTLSGQFAVMQLAPPSGRIGPASTVASTTPPLLPLLDSVPPASPDPLLLPPLDPVLDPVLDPLLPLTPPEPVPPLDPLFPPTEASAPPLEPLAPL